MNCIWLLLGRVVCRFYVKHYEIPEWLHYDRLATRTVPAYYVYTFDVPRTQVDEAAFASLEECVSSGDFDTCEIVPKGGVRNLVNPLGGLAVDLGSAAG